MVTPDALTDLPAGPASAKQVVRRSLLYRRVLEVLAAESPLPRSAVLDRVATGGDLTEYELAPAGKSKEPRWLTFATFGSTEMVAAGWLVKEPEGWSITEAGRAALVSYADSDELARYAYAAWKAKDKQKKLQESLSGPSYEIVDAALALLDAGTWTTYSELGELAGLTPSQIGTYLMTVPNEAGHRVLQVDGRPYDDYVTVDGQTADRRAVLEAEGLEFSPTGVADERRHVTLGDLREWLEDLGVVARGARRAWLVRGSSVNGRDLVPVWRERGSVSLPATKLRPVEGGLNREQLKAIVEDDYSQASYASKAAKVDELHAFLTRMQVGDLVATTSQGRLHLGTVTGDPAYVASDDGRSNLRRTADWVAGEGIDYADVPSAVSARLQVQHEVVEMTQQLAVLEQLMLDATDEPVIVTEPEPPAELRLPDATDELSSRLHIGRDWLQESIELLRERRQLIYYGPPGTGKTYVALKLAEHLAGDNVRLVQFHPAYTYEDFFEGYRPVSSGGFELKPGPLRKIVDQARDNPSTAYFLIIDEINRGNLAKIFGELYFLLEYRDRDIDLLYATDDNVGFTLPKNVFIIGTMNTADRSIALVDSAMRRRFAFEVLHPSFEPTAGLLRRWLEAEELPDEAARLLDALNARIEDADFKIGPSYFMKPGGQTPEGIERTWRTSIMPLLEEHHYGELTSDEVEHRYGLNTIRARIANAEPAGDPDAPDPD